MRSFRPTSGDAVGRSRREMPITSRRLADQPARRGDYRRFMKAAARLRRHSHGRHRRHLAAGRWVAWLQHHARASMTPTKISIQITAELAGGGRSSARIRRGCADRRTPRLINMVDGIGDETLAFRRAI